MCVFIFAVLKEKEKEKTKEKTSLVFVQTSEMFTTQFTLNWTAYLVSENSRLITFNTFFLFVL